MNTIRPIPRLTKLSMRQHSVNFAFLINAGGGRVIGLVDARTGKWIRGFEGAHREHNRYGYNTRLELRQRKKTTKVDFRDHLQAAKRSEDLRYQLNRSREPSPG